MTTDMPLPAVIREYVIEPAGSVAERRAAMERNLEHTREREISAMTVAPFILVLVGAIVIYTADWSVIKGTIGVVFALMGVVSWVMGDATRTDRISTLESERAALQPLDVERKREVAGILADHPALRPFVDRVLAERSYLIGPDLGVMRVARSELDEQRRNRSVDELIKDVLSGVPVAIESASADQQLRELFQHWQRMSPDKRAALLRFVTSS